MDVIRDNATALSGLDQLRKLVTDGTPPPIGVTMGFTLVEIEEGRAVFEGHPDTSVYNPIGSVHGGYAATLLDSACGCAVHSRLTADQGYTTLELKVAYHRALTDRSGPVRAEGRLCASATSTLLVFDRPS